MNMVQRYNFIVIVCVIALVLINVIYRSFYPLTALEQYYSNEDYMLVDELSIDEHVVQLYKSRTLDQYQVEDFKKAQIYNRWQLVSSNSIEKNGFPAYTALKTVSGVYLVSIENEKINASLDRANSKLIKLYYDNIFLIFNLFMVIIIVILFKKLYVK